MTAFHERSTYLEILVLHSKYTDKFDLFCEIIIDFFKIIDQSAEKGSWLEKARNGWKRQWRISIGLFRIFTSIYPHLITVCRGFQLKKWPASLARFFPVFSQLIQKNHRLLALRFQFIEMKWIFFWNTEIPRNIYEKFNRCGMSLDLDWLSETSQ